jgi:hypothetical protein
MKILKRKISDIKREFGLPDNHDFIGYVVNIVKSDEYLASVIHSGDTSMRGWTPLPDMAKCYQSFNKAQKEVNRYGKDAILCGLFDSPEQYIVIPLWYPESLKPLLQEKGLLSDSPA